MFRHERGLLVPQQEHAQLAFDIASHLAKKPPVGFGSFLEGVLKHDRGFGELDSDGIGEMSPERHMEILRRGFYENELEDKAAELVVKLHITRLASYNPAFKELHDEFIEATRDFAGVNDLPVMDFLRTDAYTDLCDTLSFIMSFGQSEPDSIEIEGEEFSYEIDGERVTVEPWPFAESELNLDLVAYQEKGYPEDPQKEVLHFKVVPSSSR